MKFLKLIALLLFTQCFLYKGTNFGLSLQMGFTVSPDRLVSIIILLFAVWGLMCGELQFPGLGKVGWCMLLFALICTVSSFVKGAGSEVLYRLFDFNYNPFILFIVAKGIPHSRKKLEFLSCAFLVVGAYLAINGIFEYRGLHALVWPQYILDPHVGIQFGRTRGSFVSSEALGQALTLSFVFYVLYTTHVTGIKLYWAYLIVLLTSVVIYGTNQRAAWVSFAICVVLLAITKTKMTRTARLFVGLALLGFLSGVGTHFSLWDRTLFARRQNTIQYREINNLTTLEMGKANPIFGIGFGNFKRAWPQYFQPIAGSDIRDLEDGNHNTFLGLFAELGLVGLIPYLIIFYYMFRVGLRVYKKGEEFEREFALAFLLVVIIYIFGGNFSDYRSGPFFNAVLFLLFGAVTGIEVHMALSTHRLREEPRNGQVRIGHGMVTAGLSYKQWSEWKRSRDIHLARFTRFPKQLDHV